MVVSRTSLLGLASSQVEGASGSALNHRWRGGRGGSSAGGAWLGELRAATVRDRERQKLAIPAAHAVENTTERWLWVHNPRPNNPSGAKRREGLCEGTVERKLDHDVKSLVYPDPSRTRRGSPRLPVALVNAEEVVRSHERELGGGAGARVGSQLQRSLRSIFRVTDAGGREVDGRGIR